MQLLVRRGCLRNSGATAASVALGKTPLTPPRELVTEVKILPATWYSPSFSQITSTGFVEVDEMELWLDTQSKEKTEEDEEDAEEEIDEA